MPEKNKHLLNKPEPDYEKAEMDLLRDGLRKSYMERFETMMNLIKMNRMLRKAKIIYKGDRSE